MTQTSKSIASSLPDVFSSALTTIFEEAQPGIVQVRTEGRGGGTGIIWREDGRILTNHHVIAREGAKVEVLLSDGRAFPAVVLHSNPRLDLALLKISGENLKKLPLADSRKLRTGELVFAIGHPWGQRWVVTAGIVSAVRTARLAEGFTTHYIQSDVGLAPGNSGGPLLNADGHVVGINAMIFGGDLSVSIPSSVVNDWLAELPGHRVMLGVEISTIEIPQKMRKGLPHEQESGVLIVGIRPEREATDLFVGDIILEIAGTSVKNNAALLETLAKSKERERLPITVLRGGKAEELEVATLLDQHPS